MNFTKVLLVFITVFYVSLAWGEIKYSPAMQESKTHLVALKHLATLSSDQFEGRKFSTQGSITSQLYLISILKKLNVRAFNNHYRHTFNRSGLSHTKQGTNIIGFIEGTHHINEYIILSAHYDHLGTKGRKVYNGADDNASGTAALLYYAQMLKIKPLKHSVVLLFTDGEEVNLLGAKAFISQQNKILSNVKLNINLDMIAGNKRTKKLRFISKNLSQILSTKRLNDLSLLQKHYHTHSDIQLTHGFRGTKRAGSSVKRSNWLMASDHGVFSKAGIPFIYFGVGTHKNYHTESDTYGNINQTFYLAAIDAIFQQLIYVDSVMF
jgi:Zn-dependent M28 family amino/carboxypeptidase